MQHSNAPVNTYEEKNKHENSEISDKLDILEDPLRQLGGLQLPSLLFQVLLLQRQDLDLLPPDIHHVDVLALPLPGQHLLLHFPEHFRLTILDILLLLTS